MTALDRLIPAPDLVEIDRVDLSAPLPRVWERIRYGDLGTSPLIRALFALRTLPDRLTGHGDAHPVLRVDDFASSPERPGFQLLVDDPPHEFAVGAVGKVWEPNIRFEHVADADAFRAFTAAGFIKVAWAIRLTARGRDATHLELELRVEATDASAARQFRRYFRLIGPASRFIRHTLLAALTHELGTAEAQANQRPLPGDELLTDTGGQFTHFVDVAARPEATWPWLVQMGCGRAGYYSIDLLDNANRPSAREIHPELQKLAVGDVIPATPDGDTGFEVLQITPPQALVLGGLFDPATGQQLPFNAPRPPRYWQVTWSFSLEPLDERSTRVYARARGAFSPSERLRAVWIRPVHALMETAQLRHLAARVEGRIPADDWREVFAGLGGAAAITAGLLTPFLRGHRSHWGLDAATAERAYPGDYLVPLPRWSWTHGIEIEAPVEQVWPWVAQIGADRGGFYSYQWLENLAGCELRNAETIHPEWEVRKGSDLVLAPSFPPLPVVAIEPGRWFVAHAPADERARSARRSWIEGSWLFFLEPLGPDRCRFISRYRATCSDDLATRLAFGPTLVEPIGFAMDRRMLLGVKERVERANCRGPADQRVTSAV